MSDFNIDRFEEMANLIISLQGDEDIREELEDWIGKHSNELRAAAALKQGTEQEKRIANVIAKGLPAIATGIQGAVRGFQTGDSFAGAAAVADVVGNMVTMITSMLSVAAGPPGAVVGSLLSIFSMILKMFSKQKPEKSIEEKLQSVIDVHDALELQDSLQAVQIEINKNLEQFIIHNKAKDKYPMSTIQKSLDIENKGLLMTKAGQWINRNQDIKHWEAVLAAHCYAHISLIQAVAMAMNIVEEAKGIQYLTVLLHVRNKQQFEFIQKIIPIAQNQGTIWVVRTRKFNFHGSEMFKRDAVVSKKKEWQKYAIGYTPLSFAVSNRPPSREHGGHQQTTTALFTINSTYPFQTQRDWYRGKETILVHPFRKNVDAASVSGILDARYGPSPLSTNSKKHTLVPFNSGTKHDYFDVWAIPGHGAGEIDLYTAEGNSILYWRQGAKEHTADEETKLLFRGQYNMSDGYKVGAVRASTIKTLENEEDTLSKDIIHAVYGACEVQARKTNMGKQPSGGLVAPSYWDSDHMEISVIYRSITWGNGNLQQPLNSFCVAPWSNFVGIAVDSSYLWVYRAGAIACATHTEVYASLMRGDRQPPWMVYNIPNKVGETEYDPAEMYLRMGVYYPKGLLDLSACDDGTLVGVYCDGPDFQGPVYSMTPKIDRVARTLKFEGTKVGSNGHPVNTNGWESDGLARVDRVIKQPISCWPILKGLEKVLESQKDTH